ncbi:MAG: EpsI family protein [Alphaproteobacteria bacterium]
MNRLLGSARPAMARSTIILACLLMVFGAVASFAMTPRHRIADQRNTDLETIIPRAFGAWQEEAAAGKLVLPDPEANRLANKIYNKILARSYTNKAGQTVMLVIAYGGDQSDALQLHRPEVCYAANGYRVAGLHYDHRTVARHDLVLARVDTADQYANEIVTYWMRVGERQVTTTMDRQLVKLLAGLHGIIPDGVLFRVSTRTLSQDASQEYKVHDAFIADLLSVLGPEEQRLLVGRGAPPNPPAKGS